MIWSGPNRASALPTHRLAELGESGVFGKRSDALGVIERDELERDCRRDAEDFVELPRQAGE